MLTRHSGPWGPDMVFGETKEVVKYRTHSQANHLMSRAGHPIVALAATGLAAAKWVANQVVEEVHYKCKFCGATDYEIRGKL